METKKRERKTKIQAQTTKNTEPHFQYRREENQKRKEKKITYLSAPTYIEHTVALGLDSHKLHSER